MACSTGTSRLLAELPFTEQAEHHALVVHDQCRRPIQQRAHARGLPRSARPAGT